MPCGRRRGRGRRRRALRGRRRAGSGARRGGERRHRRPDDAGAGHDRRPDATHARGEHARHHAHGAGGGPPDGPGRRSGSIVLVGSVASRVGSPGQYVDYAASKGAVDSFMLGLSKEVAADGVRVSCVRPGIIDTTIHADSGQPNRVAEIGGPRSRWDERVTPRRWPPRSCGCSATTRATSAERSSTSAAPADVPRQPDQPTSASAAPRRRRRLGGDDGRIGGRGGLALLLGLPELDEREAGQRGRAGTEHRDGGLRQWLGEAVMAVDRRASAPAKARLVSAAS